MSLFDDFARETDPDRQLKAVNKNTTRSLLGHQANFAHCSGQGPDSSKPLCRKAKQQRLERRMQKTGMSLEEIKAKV